jgi:hypothetical protein
VTNHQCPNKFFEHPQQPFRLEPWEAFYVVLHIAREAPLCGLAVRSSFYPAHDLHGMNSLITTQVIMDGLAALVDEGELPRYIPNWHNAAPANEFWSLNL